MAKRKYDYYNVATPYGTENFNEYKDALAFYGRSDKPSTLYGVNCECSEHTIIKSK